MKSNIAKCVLALSCIAIVCVTMLALANNFFGLSDQERLNRALKKVLGASTFEAVCTQGELEKFNADYGSEAFFVSAVYEAKGKGFDGYLVVDSTALGYKSKISTLTAFDPEGIIVRVVVKEFGVGETYAGKIKMSAINNDINSKIVDTAAAARAMQTGATYTAKGVLDSAKIAAKCYDALFGSPVLMQRQLVKDPAIISSLDWLFLVSNAYKDIKIEKYYSYEFGFPPIKNTYEGLGAGEILRAYKGYDNAQNEYVILQIKASNAQGKNGVAGVYGDWSLLMLAGDGRIAAVAPTGVRPYEVAGKWDARPLDDAEFLTRTLENISGMDELLAMKNLSLHPHTTSVTQSNNGILAAAYAFFDRQNEALSTMALYEGNEALSTMALYEGGE